MGAALCDWKVDLQQDCITSARARCREIYGATEVDTGGDLGDVGRASWRRGGQSPERSGDHFGCWVKGSQPTQILMSLLSRIQSWSVIAVLIHNLRAGLSERDGICGQNTQ